jgi:hypothetical protein
MSIISITLIALLLHSIQTSENTSRLLWVGDQQGSLKRATIVTSSERGSKSHDYLTLFDERRFDPFGQHLLSNPTDSTQYFEKLLLFIELPPDTEFHDYRLDIHIDKGLPICTQCDGGCARLLKRKDQDASIVLNSGSTESRYLISISDLVSDWHMLDVNVSATLQLDTVVLERSSVSVKGWPWCQ